MFNNNPTGLKTGQQTFEHIPAGLKTGHIKIGFGTSLN